MSIHVQCPTTPKYLQYLSLTKLYNIFQPERHQHSIIESMCHLRNTAMCDYQESVTTGQTH